MITGSIKNKINKIWTDIWAGGISNPVTIIDQLSYLMFVRSLDCKELEQEAHDAKTGQNSPRIFPQSATGQSMRWSRFKYLPPQQMYEVVEQRVFPALRNMSHGQLPDSADVKEIVSAPIVIKDVTAANDNKNNDETVLSLFMHDAQFQISSPQLLQKIITGLDDLYENDIADQDLQGDLYEYMLSKLSTAGHNGQFRTPEHIRDMMVELIEPTPDDIICDPACGTAGFLVSSAEYIRQHYKDDITSEQWEHFSGSMFTGYDIDCTMLRISAMNLMLHSISNLSIKYMDSLSRQNQIESRFTLCLANPPFTGAVDAENVSGSLKAVTNTNKSELLFLALILRILKPDGRCACIVPGGVLFGSSKAHKAIRQEIIENHQLQAVISMPSGVFRPYASISSGILIFKKTGTGGTDKVWFFNMQADGFSLDRKRSATVENDIPDIIRRYKNLDQEETRTRSDQSFLVPVNEIRDNGYDLSFSKYSVDERVATTYPSSTEIVSKLIELNDKFSKELEELQEMTYE